MLQPTSVNPHATLIMMFMTAVEEMALRDKYGKSIRRAMAAAPLFMTDRLHPGTSLYLVNEIACMMRDFDKYFDQ